MDRSPARAAPAAPRGAFAADLARFHETALHGRTSIRARARLWLVSPELRCVVSFRFGQAARRLRGKAGGAP